MKKPEERTPLSKIIFRVVLLGEFRLKMTIATVSIYGAAILVIPFLLSSVFSVSTTYLGFQNIAQQELMLSIYGEISSTYQFVELLLFVGLVITCALAGVSMGRKASSTEVLLSHLGVEKNRIRGLMVLVLLSVSALSTLLAFCLAVVFSTTALYLISTVFAIPATSLAISFSSLLYLLALFSLSWVFLLLGWSRTFPKLSRG